VGEFLAFLNERRRIPPDTTTRWKGHAYSIYPAAARPLLDDGVVLVGDAAGLAYAESGEGIRPAVESGLLAARTILLTEGTYTRESLTPYRQAIEARFGTRPKGAAPRVPAWLTALAGAAVLKTPWLTRRVVIERWFLHRHESALIWNASGPLASTQARRRTAAAV
jgi:flavin-dependent dehydrogenase